jgi:hypothetical protein
MAETNWISRPTFVNFHTLLQDEIRPTHVSAGDESWVEDDQGILLAIRGYNQKSIQNA